MQGCLFAELANLGASDSSERLRALLAEDPKIEARRSELEARRNRLVEIQTKLDKFQV